MGLELRAMGLCTKAVWGSRLRRLPIEEFGSLNHPVIECSIPIDATPVVLFGVVAEPLGLDGNLGADKLQPLRLIDTRNSRRPGIRDGSLGFLPAFIESPTSLRVSLS